MKVQKRIRINARLPDHDGKFRDEITQEFTIELDGEEMWFDPDTLTTIIEEINERMNQELQSSLKQIKDLGGRDYTEAEDK